MNFSIGTIPATDMTKDSFVSDFLDKCELGPLSEEKENVVEVLDLVKKRKASIHVLQDDDTDTLYGFVALKFSNFNGLACVTIDFLYTASSFRKLHYKELSNGKVSDYLMNHAIDTAQKISEDVPVGYVALMSIDDKLSQFYAGYGFDSSFDRYWMYLKIS